MLIICSELGWEGSSAQQAVDGEPLTAQDFVWLPETAGMSLSTFSYMAGFCYLIWKHPVIYLQIKCTSDHPPVTGSLFFHHLSLEWREGVGAGVGRASVAHILPRSLLITQPRYSKQ